MISRFDKDHDGTMSFAEFKAWHLEKATALKAQVAGADGGEGGSRAAVDEDEDEETTATEKKDLGEGSDSDTHLHKELAKLKALQVHVYC